MQGLYNESSLVMLDEASNQAAREDRRQPSVPRPVIQKGRGAEDPCGPFAISISDAARGMTVRFDSDAEYRRFFERAGLEKR
jgi:hypothetical protein